MARHTIAVLDDYQHAAESSADWTGLDADLEFFPEHLGSDDRVAEALARFDVVVAMRERTPFRRSRLAALPNLRLLITTGMRNASIDLDAARDLGITVCGTPSPGFATAELTMALLLTLSRGIYEEVTSMRSGGWQHGLGRDLRGARLGVIGLGRLGSQVAGLATAFGMDVVAWSENLTRDRTDEVGVELVGRDELLSTSDFVTVHLRGSERSDGTIGATELDRMKQTAYLVNTSRGPTVDWRALLAAVQSGSIAGAAIDVYETEPLPADHPLRREPRIITTPHIGYVTRETYEIFYRAAVEDIAAWDAGDPVRVLT